MCVCVCVCVYMDGVWNVCMLQDAVLILLYKCPHTTISVLILPHMCPPPTIYVSSYYLDGVCKACQSLVETERSRIRKKMLTRPRKKIEKKYHAFAWRVKASSAKCALQLKKKY